MIVGFMRFKRRSIKTVLFQNLWSFPDRSVQHLQSWSRPMEWIGSLTSPDQLGGSSAQPSEVTRERTVGPITSQSYPHARQRKLNGIDGHMERASDAFICTDLRDRNMWYCSREAVKHYMNKRKGRPSTQDKFVQLR